jgi:16S rRNA (uracil1498-N3)-methyltransferase
MRCPRIYSAQVLALGAQVTLEADAAHHLARVLRLPIGSPLILFNGDGNEYPAEIIALDKKNVVVVISNVLTEARESPLAIHLGVAISKGERMDWVIQKATELGVTEISPLQSERVEVRLHGEREEKKLAHWRAVAISACEQCARNRIPVINDVRPLFNWIENIQVDAKFVLHHRSVAVLDAQNAAPKSVALLIGPEGGLSEAEIGTAEQRGFQPLRLGPRVLRTETAPLAALSVLQYLWGDLR